jgi:1-pyrroline-5-carboxylate dehydrogenase
MNGFFNLNLPENEPVKTYAPGSPERQLLKSKLEDLSSRVIDIPLIINGKEVRTGNTKTCVMPHDHQHVLATYHLAGPTEIKQAIEGAVDAQKVWAETPWEHRIAVFLKAAERIATVDRGLINAATMLGQSKNVHQAEIDSACELIDFFRYNAYFAAEIYSEQPKSSPGVWNRLEYRPLEGFIYAIAPFNFTAIGGNLATAPVMMGNVAIWKPAATAIYSNYLVMKILMECGLPAGVINFICGDSGDISEACLGHKDLSGIHFTGSTSVFQSIWQTVGQTLPQYKSYPRLVGETGGKDYIFAHPSADPVALSIALVAGAFEYQGQKCSAASRAYLPRSIADDVLNRVKKMLKAIKMGDVRDFTNVINAVIDQRAFNRIKKYIDDAIASEDVTLLCGGGCDDQKGYFIEPTVLISKTPDSITMREEIFGPVLTVYIYEDEDMVSALDSLDTVTAYALTGAIFAQDRYAIAYLEKRLTNTAGNFYINDKPTGAVVGQQPFGGGRASGTNDKAGSKLNLLRWVTPRTIKETFTPIAGYHLPFQTEK